MHRLRYSWNFPDPLHSFLPQCPASLRCLWTRTLFPRSSLTLRSGPLPRKPVVKSLVEVRAALRVNRMNGAERVLLWGEEGLSKGYLGWLGLERSFVRWAFGPFRINLVLRQLRLHLLLLEFHIFIPNKFVSVFHQRFIFQFVQKASALDLQAACPPRFAWTTHQTALCTDFKSPYTAIDEALPQTSQRNSLS